MLDKVLSELLPPVIYRAPARIRSRMPAPKGAEDILFDGDDAMFKQVASSARTYGEYGCGASTVWMANHTGCRILSVDTSREWLDTVRQKVGTAERVQLHHAELGAIGNWGRPLSYERDDNFGDYTDWLWAQDVSPDVVLVDGRFRVCCFLSSLSKAGKDTQILFDDYIDRPHYHFVERFLAPVRICGRQALFSAPGREAVDPAALSRAIDQFRFVMD